jgi:hypothetical protein
MALWEDIETQIDKRALRSAARDIAGWRRSGAFRRASDRISQLGGLEDLGAPGRWSIRPRAVASEKRGARSKGGQQAKLAVQRIMSRCPVAR